MRLFFSIRSPAGDAAGSSAPRRPPQPSNPALRAALLLAWFGVLVAAGLGLRALAGTMGALDGRLVGDAVTIRTTALTASAHAASLFGRSWLLIPLAAVIGVIGRHRLGVRAWGPLLAVLGADALQNAIKALVNRPRPSVAHLEHVSGSSFPSGHATESTAFVLAVLVLVCTGQPGGRRIAATLVAVLLVAAVGASRVYLGVHFPSDVLAGIILGAAWAAGVGRCLAR